MKLLVLSNNDIEQLLPYKKLIPCMRKAMIDKSDHDTVNPLRQVFQIHRSNGLGFMPAYNEQESIFGAKIASVFPENKKMGLDSHQGFVVLFDFETGQPVMLCNASCLTARRTAAVSAAATASLSKKEAKTLALFGFGIQAKEHISAISQVRDVQQVKIFVRDVAKHIPPTTSESSIAFSVHPIQKSVEETIRDVDIACLCTPAKSPYLNSDQLPFGIHVNAVGACRPGFSEITIRDRQELSIFFDDGVACRAESDELKIPLKENRLSQQALRGELGQVFSKQISGRTDDGTITLFKSVGLAAQDLYAAQLALTEARNLGFGTEISL